MQFSLKFYTWTGQKDIEKQEENEKYCSLEKEACEKRKQDEKLGTTQMEELHIWLSSGGVEQ